MGEITWQGATIAWARVEDAPDLREAGLAEMGERQLARLRQLSGDRAAGFLAGRALIRKLVVRLGGVPEVLLDSACARCGSDHAAPRTPGFTLSVSHAADLVVVAVAPGAGTLGVDIEQDAAAERTSDLGRLFPSSAAPDLAGWTRIEAVIKADGRGIGIDPREVLLEPEPEVAQSGPPVWSASVPGNATRFQVATLRGPAGHVLSVAVG